MANFRVELPSRFRRCRSRFVLATTFGRRQLRKRFCASLARASFHTGPTADIDHLWDTASAVTKSVFLGATRAKSLDYPLDKRSALVTRSSSSKDIQPLLGVLPPEFSL